MNRRWGRGCAGAIFVALSTGGLVFGTIATSEEAVAGARKPPRIECDVTIPCVAEDLWAAWTTEEGLESFLARSAKVTLEEGGRYYLDLGGGNPADILETRQARILRLDAPRMLSFEWVIPLPDAATRDPMTVVTIRIEPVSTSRCRVRLEHSGWAVGDEKTEAFAYSKRAWKVVLGSLRTAMAERKRGR